MKKVFLPAMFAALLFISTPNFSAAATNILTNGHKTIEQTVRDHFSDLPVMVEIARCESNFRQFTDAGNVLRGGYGGQMVGVFQFFGRIHESVAASLGFNINTLDGNLGYARHVYENQGTTPWNSSSDCWGVVDLTPPKTPSVATATKTEVALRKQIAQLLEVLELLKQLKAMQA